MDFREVKEKYLEENGFKKDSWELRNLHRANEKFGRWFLGNIPFEEIGNIALPHYKFGAEVIPPQGAFLKDAYANFEKEKEFYKKFNRQFYDRIESQVKFLKESNSVKVFYLSEEPLFMGSSYKDMEPFKNKITHLDGLHRLFALKEIGSWEGPLQTFLAKSKNTPIN
ncbi:hypothetical protein HOD29_01810 [archaeon]|nr:hypothetical protein [archaeon]